MDDAEIEKSALLDGLVTIRLKVALFVIVPLVLISVAVYVPSAAELEASIERIDVPAPSLRIVEFKVPITPEGSPEILRVTGASKPP